MGTKFKVKGSAFRVSEIQGFHLLPKLTWKSAAPGGLGFGFRGSMSGLRFLISYFWFRFSGFDFRFSGLRFRVSGSRFRFWKFVGASGFGYILGDLVGVCEEWPDWAREMEMVRWCGWNGTCGGFRVG